MRRLLPILLAFSGCMERSPFQSDPLTVAGNIGEPTHMLVEGKFLYYGARQFDGDKRSTIGRVNLETYEVEVLARSGDRYDIAQLALDERYVYWAEVENTANGSFNGSVARVRKDGSGDTEVLAPDLVRVFGVAVDATEVFYAAAAVGSNSEVRARPKDGSGSERVIATPAEIGTVVARMALAGDLLLMNAYTRLLARPKDGSGAVTSTTSTGSSSGSFGSDQRADVVYHRGEAFFTTDLGLRHADPNALTTEAGIGASGGNVATFTVFGDYLYWVMSERSSTGDNQDDATQVRRTTIDGGHTEDVSPMQSRITAVATDDDYVYWADSDQKVIHRREHP